MESLLFTALIALFIGTLMGMLGGGGSILLVPVLLYVLKLAPRSALATSQLVMTAAASVALVVHARAGRVRWKKGVSFGVAGMCGAYLGGRAAHYVPVRALLLGFAALMMISAAWMLRRGAPVATAITEKKAERLLRDLGVGFCIGFIAGMLGAGGGFIIVPALTLLEGLSIEAAVGTSLLVIAMQSLAGALGYLFNIEVDLRLTAILAVGTASGSIVGSLLSARLPATALRRIFAIFLIAVAAFMIFRNV